MRQHFYIWITTIAVGLLAALVAVTIEAERRGFLTITSADAKVADALALLEADPGSSNSETQRAIRLAATEVDAGYAQTAAGFYILATQYRREMNLSEAEALFKRAIATAPQWSRPYAGLGSLLGRYAVGRSAEAIEVLQKATQLDPAWSRPYNLLAVILRQENRIAEAYQAAQKALDLDPGDMANHNNFANLLIAMNRFEEAEAHYDEAIRIQPNHPKPHYNLACLYSLEGKPELALEKLRQAIRLAPNLRNTADTDPDLEAIRSTEAFQKLIYGSAGNITPDTTPTRKNNTTTDTE